MMVIFLDIDGVLINLQSLRKNRADPDCVSLLNQLTDTTEAKIVVSSTWRKGGSPQIAEILTQWGVTGKVIGITPDLDHFENGAFISPSRGEETQAYLDNHPEITAFVILDDESDMGQLSHHLIQTDYVTGLTYENICDAINFLIRLKKE